MQIKATEMEGWRLETQNWIENFNSQVAELELERNTVLESSGHDRLSQPGNLIGANTPYVSKKSSQVSSQTNADDQQMRAFQTERSVA